MKRLHFPLLVVTLLMLHACAFLGVPKADTFNKQLAGGYVTVTSIRQLGTTLVTSGKLKPDDADNVLKQTDNARAGLDIAKALGPVEGRDKLSSTLTVLTGLQGYLATKGK